MSTPSAAERRSYIVRLLQNEGHASVSALSEELSVSQVTIRNDMRFLEKRQLLLRTHGGAVHRDHYVFDLPIEVKKVRHSEEKKRIGLAAAGRVDDGDTVILDGGSTSMQIARNLHGRKDLTVATASIEIALELARTGNVDVLMLGGTVRPTSASVVGSYAERVLQDLAFAKLFLAADGLDIDYGLTTTHTLEGHLNRIMMKCARYTFAVVDSSKIGRRGLSRICGVEELDALIVDSGISNEAVNCLRERGVEVMVA